MRNLVEIQSLLHAYRDFSECVVEAIAWSDFGATVTITIDYIWTSSGVVRTDYDQRVFVDLRFGLVQEFGIRNELPLTVVRDPSLLGWSHNEVSLVLVARDERSTPYKEYPLVFHHAVLRREGSPWIDVVFAELEITERIVPARIL